MGDPGYIHITIHSRRSREPQKALSIYTHMRTHVVFLLRARYPRLLLLVFFLLLLLLPQRTLSRTLLFFFFFFLFFFTSEELGQEASCLGPARFIQGLLLHVLGGTGWEEDWALLVVPVVVYGFGPAWARKTWIAR